MSWHIPQTLAQSDPNPGSGGTPEPGTPPPIEGGATTTQPADGSPTQTTAKAPELDMIWWILIFFLVMWVMIILPQRREKKKQAQLHASLKKGDRVQTIGGIRGTIAEIREGEIVLKVDESNNTRMTFARTSIQGVVEQSKSSE